MPSGKEFFDKRSGKAERARRRQGVSRPVLSGIGLLCVNSLTRNCLYSIGLIGPYPYRPEGGRAPEGHGLE